MEKMIMKNDAVLSRRVFLGRASMTVAAMACGLPVSVWAKETPAYRVLKGDTLSGIAEKHHVRLSDLMRANALRSDLIKPGQRLRIPAADDRALLGDPTATVRRLSDPLKKKARTWKTIVLHHSAVDRGNAAQYDGDHRRRGMKNGLAYHFVIGNGRGSPDGAIEVGSRWRRQLQGGHVSKDHVNRIAIGICLVGNFEKTSPTRSQLGALNTLIAYLQRDFLPTPANLLGHKDVDATLCPGRHFPLGQLKKS